MTNLNDTIRSYIASLNAAELNFLGEKAGRDVSSLDHDLKVGFILGLIETEQLILSVNKNPFIGAARETLQAEFDDAKARAKEAKTKGTQKKYEAIRDERFAELKQVPSVWYERRQDEAQYRADALERWIDSQINTANAVREELAAKILTSTNEALYQIGSVGGKVKALEMGRLAQLVRDIHEDSAEKGNQISLMEAAERLAEDLKQTLLRDQLRGTSFSAFSNAKEAEERAAASDFIDSMRWRFRL